MQTHSVIHHLLRVCEFLLIARDPFETMAQAQRTKRCRVEKTINALQSGKILSLFINPLTSTLEVLCAVGSSSQKMLGWTLSDRVAVRH